MTARGIARAIALSPVVARPGYWLATLLAFLWGCLLLGHLQQRRGLWLFENLPAWAFGRGGTTIGAIYLTRSNAGDGVLDHEAVHRAQWRRYGLAFIPLYLAAGQDALRNRFEIEAGLERGGYLPRHGRPGGAPTS